MTDIKFEPWRCQKCGAYIGYVGRFFQWMLGCFLIEDCTWQPTRDKRD